jgi:hypothetical protein
MPSRSRPGQPGSGGGETSRTSAPDRLPWRWPGSASSLVGVVPRNLASVRLGRAGLAPPSVNLGRDPVRVGTRHPPLRRRVARHEASASPSGVVGSFPGHACSFGTVRRCLVTRPAFARGGYGAELVVRSRSSDRGRSARTPRARGLSSAGRTLEGNEAHGRIGCPPAGNGWMGATDSTAEQRLEADAPVHGAPRAVSGNGGGRRCRGARRERQGGNGHGDVVRLSSGGILRGV